MSKSTTTKAVTEPVTKPAVKAIAKPVVAVAPPTSATPLVVKEPRSKQQAAVQAGMFLHGDDVWSLAYFNDADLHATERKLFG